MKKIGIDIGHNVSYDGGALGFRDENELNRLVGELVISRLKNLDFNVVNCTPNIATSLSDSLSQRCNIANSNNVDLFVSIHHNAGGGEGSEALVYKDGLGSKIGISVLREIEKIGYRNRGIKYMPNLFVLRHTSMPAVLIECAFVDNRNDMNKYNHIDMAEALVRGIANYYGVNSNKRGESNTYIVKSGDTLWSIARRYNTTVNNIVNLNKMSNPDFIRAGQEIRIN